LRDQQEKQVKPEQLVQQVLLELAQQECKEFRAYKECKVQLDHKVLKVTLVQLDQLEQLLLMENSMFA
jgi:hypothetical protein